jgi:septal ring factor EnvC (AmiA/AmiB activator)
MSQQEPRKFWLNITWHEFSLSKEEIYKSSLETDDIISVIECRAYESLAQELAAWKEQCEKLEKKIDSLKAEIHYLNRSLADERSGDCDKDKTIRRLTNNFSNLQTENKNLLSALEKISLHWSYFGDTWPADVAKEAIESHTKFKGG